MKNRLQREGRFKTAVPQSWWNRVKTRIATSIGIPVAFAASIFAATPAIAEEAGIVDTTTPTTMEQVDSNLSSDVLPEVELAPISEETVVETTVASPEETSMAIESENPIMLSGNAEEEVVNENAATIENADAEVNNVEVTLTTEEPQDNQAVEEENKTDVAANAENADTEVNNAEVTLTTEESQENSTINEENSTNIESVNTEVNDAVTEEKQENVAVNTENIISDGPITVTTTPEVEKTIVTETTTSEGVTTETTTTTVNESYSEYTLFVQDGIVNIVGEVSEEDLTKLNEALVKQYGENIPEVRIWSGLEQGNNQLGSTGVVVTLSEEGKVELNGEGITEVKQLTNDFETVQTEEDAELVEVTAGSNSIKLSSDEYVVTKDENGVYHIICGGIFGNTTVSDIMETISKEHPELNGVDFVRSIADGDIDVTNVEVIMQGKSDSLRRDNEEANTENIDTSDEIKPIVEPTPTPENPTPTPENPTPTPENPTPTPENPTPTPENPTPTPEIPTPTPEIPTPETPNPVPTPISVPQQVDTPRTGNDTKGQVAVRLLGAGMAGLIGGIALNKRKKYSFGLVGPEFENILLESSTKTFNNQFRKLK